MPDLVANGCRVSIRTAVGAAALACIVPFCIASADPYPVVGHSITLDLLSAPIGPAVLSISESDTHPYVNDGPATVGVSNLYLWLDCATSVAAVQAKLVSNLLPLSFTPSPGIFNGGSGGNVRLFMNGCVEDFPLLLGSFSVFNATGGTAWSCLGPLDGLELAIADCSSPYPAKTIPRVIPHLSVGTPPFLLQPCFPTPLNCHQLAVSGRGYRTRSAGTGAPVALGLMLPSNSAIQSVDWASVVYAGSDTWLPGLTYVPNSLTAAGFASLQPGDWSGFFAIVSDSIPADVDVDVVFNITPAPGATLEDVAVVLQGCRIGTDHADSSGAILGGAYLDIITPVVPVTVAPGERVPTLRRLLPPEPNPLTGTTRLAFELARSQRAELSVYDVAGRAVWQLPASQFAAGLHQVVWDGRDRHGKLTAPGVYFVELKADDGREIQKLTVVR